MSSFKDGGTEIYIEMKTAETNLQRWRAFTFYEAFMADSMMFVKMLADQYSCGVDRCQPLHVSNRYSV